jgi:hypothetical protein
MKHNNMTRFGLAAAATIAAALALAGCKNAIADEVTSIQEKAVSPVIAVQANNAAVENGGSLTFGLVSVSGESSIKLTITNKGVDPLKIDVDKINLTPGASTATGIFSITAAPAATVEAGASTAITIRFAPVAEISEAASLTIPTNDIETPSFTCSITGTGLGVALNTAAVSSVTYTTALSGGTVTSTGGKTITERGICWGTSPDPTISDIKRADIGTGPGSYSCSISPLLPGTFYYVRAYATTSTGVTAYGLSQSFTTIAATAPTTATVTAINVLSATVGWTTPPVNTGLTLSECGVCWSTTSGPTATDTHLSSGTTANTAHTDSATPLTKATTYYLRAYAVLSNGSATTTVYGAEKSFKTVGYKGSSGGYVFYDRGETIDGWRYLEAAPSAIAGTCAWGPDSNVSTNPGIGTGRQNTSNAYVAGEYAAAKCLAATYGSCDDFFLPSKEELSLMLLNLAPTYLVEFNSFNYWSSTTENNTAAYYLTNSSTNSFTTKNNTTLHVWAIRQY